MNVEGFRHGTVELEDTMGGDQAVVRAARICYGHNDRLEDDMKIEKLLNKLMSSQPSHNTVFEHSVFRFFVRCPLFVQRQWMRHRIGSFNERSLRYVKLTDDIEYFVPDDLSPAERVIYCESVVEGIRGYQSLLALRVRAETARATLPLAIYTEFIWTVNAWSLMNFLEKREDRHAQREIRAYAQTVHALFKQSMPITATAFEGRQR